VKRKKQAISPHDYFEVWHDDGRVVGMGWATPVHAHHYPTVFTIIPFELNGEKRTAILDDDKPNKLFERPVPSLRFGTRTLAQTITEGIGGFVVGRKE